jgi:hypothetical protein
MHDQADDVDRRNADGSGEWHPAAATHGDDRENHAKPEGRPTSRRRF